MAVIIPPIHECIHISAADIATLPIKRGDLFPHPWDPVLTCFGQWVLAKVIQKTWKYVLIGACFLLLSRILLPSYEQARVSLLEDGRPQRQSPWLPQPSQKRLQTWKWAPPRPPGPSQANSAPKNHQIIGNVKCFKLICFGVVCYIAKANSYSIYSLLDLFTVFFFPHLT